MSYLFLFTLQKREEKGGEEKVRDEELALEKNPET